MADKDKEAYWKGWSDRKNFERSKPGVISEILTPSYRPPKGHEEAYKQGWKDAERDSRR